ncbi:helix-turn-helix domain-containing protein [Streptomyces rubellomurinus]|uniref:XRE family transcriptional regulator n=1 Tax=Streptomyces rubellomurinus (strain ATCC 31215) TaxID=359131 RepID=A0A0F2T4T0_STRR3|nr:helix-turn-helix transcriptional regulator [Streptomyces rubellomurinus]KJS58198.1 XRE family transcriptional regulator [Streptomyces rubellomurinus]
MSSSPLSSAQAARKALADQLDQIRRDAGLSGLELAVLCGWHKSKSSRIARGLTVPSDSDIRAWCTACDSAEKASDLIAASRTAESMYTQWRDLHRDGMRRVHQRTLPLYQRTRKFKVYASNVMPGMTQTTPYATGLLRSITTFQGTPDDVEQAVEARLNRSRVLNDARHQFALILEEAVLYYGVCDDEALAGQLDHLLGVFSLQNVSVGIIPFRARRTIWPLEAFYAFDDSLVAIETLTAEINVTAPGEIRTYHRAFAELAKIAVHGDEARSRIAKARNALG